MENGIMQIALVLSIIALLISGCGIAYMVMDKPSIIDLSSIETDIAYNKIDINNLDNKVDNIKVDNIVDENDLDELEDDLERYCRNEVKEECDYEDGENWYDMSDDEYECLLESSNIICETTGLLPDFTTSCEIVANLDDFEDCLE